MNLIILGDKYRRGKKSKGCQGLISYKKSKIINYQIQFFQKFFDLNNIIYIGGHEFKSLKSYIKHNLNDSINLIYNHKYEETNDGYSINLIRDFLNNNCLFIRGDTIPPNSLKLLQKDRSTVFSTKSNINSELGFAHTQDKILHIDFDLPNIIHDDIYYIEKNDMKLLKILLQTQPLDNSFLFEILNKMIDSGITFTHTILK